jgi:hypothetical protein
MLLADKSMQSFFLLHEKHSNILKCHISLGSIVSEGNSNIPLHKKKLDFIF